MEILAFLFLVAAGVGLAAIAAQHLVLWTHVRQAPPVPRRTPPVSILKPLCGIDDGLEGNLASFASIEYPEYEVVLGVRDARDAAYPAALSAAARWPGRFRVALQRGEPGMNPKVNQLATLARAARHDVLVVSDSNVRVGPGYLSEIAALLEDEAVGLVTHPIAGVGEASVGSLMDHLHLAGSITPGIVGAKRLAGRDFVVGKSMALRRADLDALGGFEAVKDVLAEDWVLGVMVPSALGKRVAVARWSSAMQTTVPFRNRLAVEILRFEGPVGGTVVLKARYALFGPDGRKVISAGESIVREPTGGADYEALTAAMSRALAAFSREVAEAIPAR